MTRRTKSSLIDDARRAALISVLEMDGVDREKAELWCDAWDAEAARRELVRDADYWRQGTAWVDERRIARKRLGDVG